MHYNFHIPVRDTKRLLDHLGIEPAAVLGHSMGGMVVSRFAMSYPETTTHAVFVNQIGMSDSRPGREWNDRLPAIRSRGAGRPGWRDTDWGREGR